MKRILGLTGVLACAGSLIWVGAQVGGGRRPVGSLFPAGPVVYLEAKNFQPLLQDWNKSEEKKLWLSSANYQVFSRSNLFLKLNNAQHEFAAAAGVPPDMALLANVAGAESGIAIYDIGALEFLYITHLPAAQATNSSLWRARGSYQTRQAAGIPYYVKVDKASQRVAAFAASNDFLLLATREDLLASALVLLGAQAAPAMTSESWYIKSMQTAHNPGDLRLVLNMRGLMASPYMRSYWIQRNASQLMAFEAAISDLNRTSAGMSEDRVLFRINEEQAVWNEDAVAQITRLAPANAGLYRAYASPSAEDAFAMIREKLLEPQAGTGASSQGAPGAGVVDSITGTEADLEIRIDESALENGRQSMPDALRKLLSASPLDAILYVGATRPMPDGVFAGIDSAVVLLRSPDWDLNAAKAALVAAGATFDGPFPAALNASGPVLVVASRADFAQSILGGMAKRASVAPARYVAVYQHGRELANFERMTHLIDAPSRNGDAAPAFLSDNVASVGSSLLGHLDSAFIRVHDSGGTVEQKLVNKLKP